MQLSEQGFTRKNSGANRSSSSLTRRRSLIQTPGVATRSSPVEGRRRTWNSWRTPQLNSADEAKWKPFSSKAPPSLGRLTGLDLAENCGDPSTPRAQTPGELDYSHLGSLKLGTLVVTNGAPSPAPSAKVLYQPFGANDYFSEAGSGQLMMKPTRRRGHSKSKSSVLPMTAPMYKDLHGRNNEQSISKDERLSNNIATGDRMAITPTGAEYAKKLRIMNKTPDSLEHDSTRLAQTYQAELPSSPFVTKPSHNTQHDEGFVSDDAMSLKDEVTRMLDDTIFAEPAAIAEIIGSRVSPTAPSKPVADERQARARQRPLPRTADSGYSSGGSLRVVDRTQQKEVQSPTFVQHQALPLHGDGGKQEQPLRIKSAKQNAGLQPPKPLPPLPVDAVQTQRRPTVLKIPDPSPRSSVRSSTSEAILSPQTPQSIASKSSFDSTSSGAHKRLQRRRPSQAELPVVQACQPIPEGTIPDVPENVRAKFSRRMSNTPGMECLTQTYQSKDHELADDVLLDQAKIASPAVAQLAELEPDRPPTSPTHGRLRSLSLFRRRSYVDSKQTEKGVDDVSMGVVDLGTIASSLGQSPYDAAMSRPLKKSVTSPTHPHQLGNQLPRAKSMVNMDSKAAAELARVRSKDRALAERELPQQRRRSYHNLKMEVGEAKAAKRRPQSFNHDIPPVPCIDGPKTGAMRQGKPQLQSEGHKMERPDLSFSARSRERGQVVSGLVDKYDYYSHDQVQHNVDWEVHSKTWSQRRKSIGEGLRTNNEMGQASASKVNSRTLSQPPEDMAAWGRYSGGLGYGYEGRGAGIGGSAGTRSLHSYASNKSLPWRNQYGVDLSDVPIVLQRV